MIKDKSRVPPGLYDYTIKETGASYKAHSFGLLVAKVREGLLANQISFDETGLSSVIESDYCLRHPENCVDYLANDEPPELAAQEHGDLLTRVAATVGIPAADALAKLSKMLGVHCQACNARHRIIRGMRKLGLKETLRQLKETI